MTSILSRSPPSFANLFKRRKSSLNTSAALPEEWETVLSAIDIGRGPIHVGKIFKQSSNDANKFNKRFFVLYPKILLYYEYEKRYYDDLRAERITKCSGYFKLDELHLTLVPADERHPNAKFCFKLHIPHSSNTRNEILLAFHSRRAKRKWMGYLQSQNPHLFNP